MTPFVLLGALAAMDLTSLIDPLWKAVTPKPTERPVSWRYELTPALPAQWPPTSNAAATVRYAYGAGLDPSLRDAELHSAPFVRVELASDGTTKVSRLSTALEAIAPQGFHPISRGEAELQSIDLTEAASTGQMSSLRAPWCLWLRNHGVVGAHLTTKHPAFFGALKCETVKR